MAQVKPDVNELLASPATATSTMLVRSTPKEAFTFTAVLEAVVVPSPSWPAALAPQHQSDWSSVTAQVWVFEVATATAPVSGVRSDLRTATGVVLWVIELSPSCPWMLPPQHQTPPFLIAQLEVNQELKILEARTRFVVAL
jgi:hypothetical protein